MRHDGEEEGVRPWKTVRMETWLNEVKSVAESILNRFELSVDELADALSLSLMTISIETMIQNF